MKLVFIAIPTKGTVQKGAMTETFLKHLASLYLAHPDVTFWAPMVQDYALLKYMPSIDASWDAWGAHCRRMIESCDEVWVLKYDGWDTSKGVAGEIEHAKQFGKPVKFVIAPKDQS
jgi:hypothetical protein